MGADLISFICVGPNKIASVAKNRKAVAQIEKCLKDQDFSCALYDTHEELVDAFEMRYTKHGGPQKLVADLISAWEHYERDTATRPLNLSNKKKDNRKIVVAGDMSWGDEPDGVGFQALKWAEIFGLLEIYGIT